MVSLKDIAEKLGVGVSTVSAVLNNKEYCYVSEAKKKLILETSREMEYIPNQMSRGMQGLPTKTIGVIGSLFTVPVVSELMDSLNKEISKAGYSVMLGDSHMQWVDEKRIISEFLSRGIDGLLICSSYTKTELENLLMDKVPYVNINQEFEGLSVTVDRSSGILTAFDHLVKEHLLKKIGFLVSSLQSNANKFEGYKTGFKKHRIEYKEDYCIETPDSSEGVKSVCKRILDTGLEAVITSNDNIAGLLIKHLTHAGMNIPNDMAVIGFDGIDCICELVNPSLTSVKQPMNQVAKKSVELLLKQINKEKVTERTYYIKPELRIGGSCGCKINPGGKNK